MSPGPPALALTALGIFLAGCAVWFPAARASQDLLAKGDALAGQGDHGGAITAYSEVIARYPETPAAARARILREALSTVQKLRAELLARDSELAALRRGLAAREAELGRLERDAARHDVELRRLRAELATRQTEITRLATESERLRADLDQLKRIDLRLEQRRP